MPMIFEMADTSAQRTPTGGTAVPLSLPPSPETAWAMARKLSSEIVFALGGQQTVHALLRHPFGVWKLWGMFGVPGLA